VPEVWRVRQGGGDVRDHHDFSKGGSGVQTSPPPARATTRLVLGNRVQTILDEFAERVCPESAPEFLGECLRRWEETRTCEGD